MKIESNKSKNINIGAIRIFVLILLTLFSFGTLSANASAPDLVCTGVSWNASSGAVTGHPLTFTATVLNQGNAPTPAGTHLTVAFFVDGIEVAWSFGYTSALQPGASVILTADGGPTSSGSVWTAVGGTHWLQAVVDDQNLIAESVESNNIYNQNVAITSTQKPDLVCRGISWTPTNVAAGAITGNGLLFSTTIVNQGTAATAAGLYPGVSFYVDGVEVSWHFNTIGSLAPGASITLSADDGPSHNPVWTATAGSHVFKVIVDDRQLVDEVHEDNNSSSVPLTIAATLLPDLVCTNVTWRPTNASTGAVVGSGITFGATVANQGTAPTNPGTQILVAYQIDGSVVAWTGSYTASIAPGQSAVLQADSGPGASPVWTATLGLHTLKAVVDDQNLVMEGNENNNERYYLQNDDNEYNTNQEKLNIAAPLPSATPATIGSWSTPFPWADAGHLAVPIHASVLPNGKIISWSVDKLHDCTTTTDGLYVWDPTNGSVSDTDAANLHNCLFCSGHCFLPDGKLIVAGGHYGADYFGTTSTYVYDYITNAWTVPNVAYPEMNFARWYPTLCALSSGDVRVSSGTIDGAGKVNYLDQVWSSTSNIGWGSPSGQFVGYRHPWGDLYPWLHLAPNGRVITTGGMAGPDKTTYYISESLQNAQGVSPPTGKDLAVGTTLYNADRSYGSSVIYDTDMTGGKIIIIGGGTPTNTAETIDLNAASPAWHWTASMSYARRQMNATVLPDGTILVSGGMSGSQNTDLDHNESSPVYAAELWNPISGTWTKMASMQIPRLYHSEALLLPDGRVLSTGGGHGGDFYDHPNAEIYSPPYLFKGARPTITSAPSAVTRGQVFNISTPDAMSITKVTWIRLPSVTHSFNQNQRINVLKFTNGNGILSITPPANANLCPPGDYMLFILNSNGVPSVSKIMRIS